MKKLCNPKLLLSSPFRPFGQRFGDAFACRTDVTFQLTWAQDVFRIESTEWHWGLDLIAINLHTPTTVLHYPTYRQFAREIKKNYEYVGLSFNNSTFHKLKKMVKAVKKFSPNSKIILGGYGTALPDSELVELGDYICREEGITYMRRLLGEDESEFRYPLISVQKRFLSLSIRKRTGIIFSSVGCPYGCDFCATSHFYGRRQIRFLKTGKEIFNAMLVAKEKDYNLNAFVIMDEDFLVDYKRGLDFLKSVKKHTEMLDVMIFSSVRSICQFKPLEIAEMSITRIWIGFEGLKAGYAKQEGKDFRTLVNELRTYGISVTASMIIGFDYQTGDTIEEEFKELIACAPTMTQILLFTPCAGTPAWKRLESQGRLNEEVKKDYRLHDGFTLLYRHPHLNRIEIEALLKDLCKREYNLLGPSVFRFIYTEFLGYMNLKDSLNPLLRKRANLYLNRIKTGRILFRVGISFAPNSQIRNLLKEQYKKIVEEIGDLNQLQKIQSYLLILFVLWTRLRFKYEIFMQPKFIKKEYPGDTRSRRSSPLERSSPPPER